MPSCWCFEACATIDQTYFEQAQQRQLALTKPPGSLGRMEEIAVTLSAMQGRIDPCADNIGIAIFAGDHGVAVEGVSAFPQVVTGEMVKNFVRGGAAISVLAENTNSELLVINAGTISESDFGEPVIDTPVALGTGNLAIEPAMSQAQCEKALLIGKEIIDDRFGNKDLVIGGEMGIANTTSATALAAKLGIGGADILVGSGTGVDQAGLSRKLNVINKALDRTEHVNDPIEILGHLGGFEIAALVGFYIRAAQCGKPVMVDGFISSVSALVACRINECVRPWLLFSHTSAEPGHRRVLESMQANPILDFGMRLGEGSGGAIVISLVRSACKLQNEMATFDEANITDNS